MSSTPFAGQISALAVPNPASGKVFGKSPTNSMPIKSLPADVVNLIAAGETIDSMAAVVRELSENALDAGATRIQIDVYPQRWRVRISDNGSGMSAEDLTDAAQPNTTSKIRDRGDLQQIHSLGFRGAALHGIAQFAKLEIYSRARQDDCGWHCRYDRSGNLLGMDDLAIAIGTIVDADDIFGTWVARRDVLPIERQLLGVREIVTNMAISHPFVGWYLRQNDKPWFNILSSANLPTLAGSDKTIAQVLSRLQLDDLLPIDREIVIDDNLTIGEDNRAKFSGCIGLPERAHRHRADWVKIAINGRVVDAPELSQAAISTFHRILPRDRFPICFLHLKIPPEYIDWHRHPAKSEIYLHQNEYWQKQIQNILDRALNINATELTDALPSARLKEVLKAAESKSTYTLTGGDLASQINPQNNLTQLRAIGQALRTYIVAENPTGMWLIEQHVAHERILYEDLICAWKLIDLPAPIMLTKLTEKQVENLRKNGFEIDEFGEKIWAVRNLPKIIAESEYSEEIIREIARDGTLDNARATIACRQAIKNGTPLSLPEMQDLLDRWQKTKHPRTCPHGRPIYLAFDEAQLARSFRRRWNLA
jgi:DNA mismatch repair protein MutL